MRFGLYWVDNADMTTPEGRKTRANRIKSLFLKHGADMWRSDATNGKVLETDYWSVKAAVATYKARIRPLRHRPTCSPSGSLSIR